MRKFNLLSILLVAVGTSVPLHAQTAGKQMKKDDVYFSIARKMISINESPASALVAELDGVIEISELVMSPDGKAVVTVKERAPSNAAYTNKSTRLQFAPPASGDEWVWVQFEDNRKFYPVDKLFPYTKDELGKRKALTVAKWTAFVTAVNKQGESAQKSLDTAKAVLKADPAPLADVVRVRAALAEAMKENKTEDIINAYRELQQLNDPVGTLSESQADLKANDAYLRLVEEFKNSVKVTASARNEYLQSVAAYNESLVRLPFALAAHGLLFNKIEANIDGE